MSAALNVSSQLPTIDAALDLTLDTASIDIEITIYGGLDPDTDELLDNARHAAETLSREYGVYAVVVPRTLYWGMGPGPTLPYSMPILVINGREVASGIVLSPEEIVEEALALLGLKENESPPLINSGTRSGNRQAALATW